MSISEKDKISLTRAFKAILEQHHALDADEQRNITLPRLCYEFTKRGLTQEAARAVSMPVLTFERYAERDLADAQSKLPHALVQVSIVEGLIEGFGLAITEPLTFKPEMARHIN